MKESLCETIVNKIVVLELIVRIVPSLCKIFKSVKVVKAYYTHTGLVTAKKKNIKKEILGSSLQAYSETNNTKFMSRSFNVSCM